ncbi:MAG: hypothetical protein HKP09_01305 [Enterobacterales bacterium]|nr:hypothetical protein [Enterobacterales bacterium]
MTNQTKEKHNKNTPLEEGNKVEKTSVFNGFWFYFQDGDDEIAVFGSGWSGKEVVYFNDNPVSEDRTFKFESTHEFTKNNKTYKIVYKVISMLTGETHCLLYIDGELKDEQKKAVIAKGSGKKALLSILGFFAVGMIFGYLGAKVALYFVGS